MKVLTVRQPWASAIIQGGKTIENRVWRPSTHGRIAIHAGAQPDRDADPWVPLPPNPRDYGAVLGTVVLASAHEEHSLACAANHCAENPWAMWSVDLGLNRPVIHWILRNPEALLTPIRAKGRLGFWESPSITDLLSMPENYRKATP